MVAWEDNRGGGGGGDWRGAERTDRTLEAGTFHSASLAGALTACLAWLAPGIALSEGPALAVTDLSGGWLAGWEWMKIMTGC